MDAKTILGDFEIIRELGRGGMGIVYEARQVSLNRKVALKVLSSGLGLSSKAVLRFRREAEAAAKLHHTNIVPIYATGEDRGVNFYAMELVNGPSLDQVIRQMKCDGEPLLESKDPDSETNHEADHQLPDWVAETIAYEGPTRPEHEGEVPTEAGNVPGSSVVKGRKYFDTVATMVADAADALDHAHDHGVIHRDIKPSNLLLGPDGRLSINDFGLARVLEQPGMTMSGEFVGTPRYMSPEQITAGRAPLDHRTDIYSLGASLYELLTLEPPFPGKTRDEVIGQILHKDPKPPRKLNRAIPSDLETICLKAIERDPDRRYQTAAQMAADLRAFVNRFAISAKRIGPVGRTKKWARRNPIAAMSLGFVFVLAFFGIVAFSASRENQRQAELRFRENQRQAELRFRESQRQAELKGLQDEFFLDLLRGDIRSAEDLRDEALRKNASKSWELLSRGQIKIQNGDYQQARDDFQAVVNDYPDNIKARALLAVALIWSGDEYGYYKQLDILEKEDPAGFEDNVFLGYAFNWKHPRTSLEYLRKADEEEPNHPFVQLLLAMSCRFCALDAIDTEERIALSDEAVEAASVAKALLDSSPLALAEFALANLASGLIHKRLAESDDNAFAHEQISDRRLADAIAVQLDLEKGIQHFDVQYAHFMMAAIAEDYAGEIIAHADLLEQQDFEPNPYIANLIGLAFARRGNYPAAFAWHSKAGIQFKLAKFMEFLSRIICEKKADHKQLQQEFRRYVDQKLEDQTEVYLLYDWVVCALLLDEEYCDKLTKYVDENTAHKFDEEKTQVRYLRGQGPDSPERFLRELPESRRDQLESLFFVGIKAISSGDRDSAQKYLQDCIETDYHAYYVYWISRVLLDKLEEDPEWPLWIPAAGEE